MKMKNEKEIMESKQTNFGKEVVLKDGKNTVVILTMQNFFNCLKIGYSPVVESSESVKSQNLLFEV